MSETQPVPRNTNSNLFVKGLDSSIDNKALHDTFSHSSLQRKGYQPCYDLATTRGLLIGYDGIYGVHYTHKDELAVIEYSVPISNKHHLKHSEYVNHPCFRGSRVTVMILSHTPMNF